MRHLVCTLALLGGLLPAPLALADEPTRSIAKMTEDAAFSASSILTGVPDSQHADPKGTDVDPLAVLIQPDIYELVLMVIREPDMPDMLENETPSVLAITIINGAKIHDTPNRVADQMEADGIVLEHNCLYFRLALMSIKDTMTTHAATVCETSSGQPRYTVSEAVPMSQTISQILPHSPK